MSGKVIWKYRVAWEQTSLPVLEIPEGARLLHVGEQAGEVFLWALVDPQMPSERRYLVAAVTGGQPAHNLGEHLGTVLLHDGAFVLHLFERARPN